MLVRNRYSGKTKEEAINNAKIALQELEKDLYIKEIEVKNSLFNKKVEIEVIRHDDVIEYIKEYLKELIKNMGLTCNLEVKKRENGVNITVISDNNSILIGKNGRTLNALNQLLKQVLFKNKILYNSNVTEAQKAIATQEIAKVNNTKNAIMISENLILTKGFKNVVILVNEDSANVVVEVQEELSKDKVAILQNIVARELSKTIENIHISEKRN